MRRPNPITGMARALPAWAKQHWRTLASLAAGCAVMALTSYAGYQGDPVGSGADWNGLLTYLCGGVVAVAQADRLLRR